MEIQKIGIDKIFICRKSNAKGNTVFFSNYTIEPYLVTTQHDSNIKTD